MCWCRTLKSRAWWIFWSRAHRSRFLWRSVLLRTGHRLWGHHRCHRRASDCIWRIIGWQISCLLYFRSFVLRFILQHISCVKRLKCCLLQVVVVRHWSSWTESRGPGWNCSKESGTQLGGDGQDHSYRHTQGNSKCKGEILGMRVVLKGFCIHTCSESDPVLIGFFLTGNDHGEGHREWNRTKANKSGFWPCVRRGKPSETEQLNKAQGLENELLKLNGKDLPSPVTELNKRGLLRSTALQTTVILLKAPWNQRRRRFSLQYRLWRSPNLKVRFVYPTFTRPVS